MPVRLTVSKMGAKLGRKVNPKTLVEADLADKQINSVGSLANCRALTTLNLTKNRITRQRDVAGVFSAPALAHLWLAQNPLTRQKDYRELLIAHIPTLETLDGVEITVAERTRAYRMFPVMRPDGWESVSEDDSATLARIAEQAKSASFSGRPQQASSEEPGAFDDLTGADGDGDDGDDDDEDEDTGRKRRRRRRKKRGESVGDDAAPSTSRGRKSRAEERAEAKAKAKAEREAKAKASKERKLAKARAAAEAAAAAEAEAEAEAEAASAASESPDGSDGDDEAGSDDAAEASAEDSGSDDDGGEDDGDDDGDDDAEDGSGSGSGESDGRAGEEEAPVKAQPPVSAPVAETATDVAEAASASSSDDEEEDPSMTELREWIATAKAALKEDVDAMNYSAVTAFADVLGGLIGAGEVMHKRVIAMEDETALMKFMALAQGVNELRRSVGLKIIAIFMTMKERTEKWMEMAAKIGATAGRIDSLSEPQLAELDAYVTNIQGAEGKCRELVDAKMLHLSEIMESLNTGHKHSDMLDFQAAFNAAAASLHVCRHKLHPEEAPSESDKAARMAAILGTAPADGSAAAAAGDDDDDDDDEFSTWFA